MSCIFVNGIYMNNAQIKEEGSVAVQQIVDIKKECKQVQTLETREQKCQKSGCVETIESEYQQIKTEIIVKEEEIDNDSETNEQQPLSTSKYRKYACDFCPKRFKQRYALYEHREEAHGRKLVDCITCGKTFASKCTLKRHNKRFHSQSLTEAFPYDCDICHQRFNSSKKHADHKKLHSDPDTFKCQKCEKRFANSFALTRHTARHASERQVCKTCKRTYKTAEDLQKHVGLHTGKFWCDVCSKVFPSKGNLTMHKKTHLREHAYFCRFCGQCFRCNLVRFGHEKLCGNKAREIN